jgi:protein-disulfide isomerase
MQFAVSIGIKNIKEFSQCLGSGKYAAVVANNFNLALSIGLTATPSFVLYQIVVIRSNSCMKLWSLNHILCLQTS